MRFRVRSALLLACGPGYELQEESDSMRRPNLAPYYKWLALVTAILMLTQAFLAGRGLWLDRNLIDVHGMVANGIFLIVVVQLGLTLAIGARGALGQRLLVANGLLVLLVLVQTGLGYSGRTGLEARAWHIPLGVLLFGLSVVIAMMAPQLLARTGEERIGNS